MEHLFTGTGIKAILKIGVARRNLLAEERPRLQEQKSDGGSRPENVKGWGTEKALGTENREAWAEQRHLRASPDGLDLAAKFEGVIAASVGHVVSYLEVLLVVAAHAAYKAA